MTEQTQEPSYLAIENYVNAAAHYYFPGLLLLIVVTVFIVLLTRRRMWVNFAGRWKWMSRFVLFVLSFYIAVFLNFASMIMFMLPGKIALELPTLPMTAIKTGIYSVYMKHEISSKLPPESSDVVDCIFALSNAEAKKHLDACGGSSSCSNMPLMSKQDVLSRIRGAEQEKSASPKEVVDVCKGKLAAAEALIK